MNSQDPTGLTPAETSQYQAYAKSQGASDEEAAKIKTDPFPRYTGSGGSSGTVIPAFSGPGLLPTIDSVNIRNNLAAGLLVGTIAGCINYPSYVINQGVFALAGLDFGINFLWDCTIGKVSGGIGLADAMMTASVNIPGYSYDDAFAYGYQLLHYELGNLSKLAAAGNRGKAPVQINKAVGDGFRNEIVDLLRQNGYKVNIEVPRKTILGWRFVDAEVTSPAGKFLGGLEFKTGGSRYLPAQRAKDWLLKTFGPQDDPTITNYVMQIVRNK